MSHLRGNLAKARGLGSAKSGTAHFIAERLTALALVPLGLWFVLNVIGLAISGDPLALVSWLKSPFAALMTALFVIFSFWHSRLGVQVIIEDYVHKPFWRNSLLLVSAAAHIMLALLCVMSLVQLHFLSDVSV